MKIITQISLFEEENMGDLEKLSRVFQILPDEPLINALNQDRGKGRNDFPTHAMWRAFLAKFVFQHPTIESLCRELGRNSQLRQLCGFQFDGVKIGQDQSKLVLAAHAMTFSRFLKRLSRHKELIYDMFEMLVQELYEALPDFGRRLAMDGKIIESKAHRPSEGSKGDLRGEHDGSWTKKTYHDKENRVSKTRTYFGFRVHLICDSVYELPIAFRVLPAHVSEKPTAREMVEENQMIDWGRAKVMTLDSGYEDSKLQ